MPPGPSTQSGIARSADGISTTITFQPDGPRTIDVTFNIMNDAVALEDVETYNVILTPTTNATTLGAIPVARVEITDDDSQ